MSYGREAQAPLSIDCRPHILSTYPLVKHTTPETRCSQAIRQVAPLLPHKRHA